MYDFRKAAALMAVFGFVLAIGFPAIASGIPDQTH